MTRWSMASLGGVLVAAATIGMYGSTLGYGFHYDDYHFVRPYPAAEIGASFHGPWDPAGIEVPFYRPLTIVLYAVRFHYFGVNASAYHGLSLGMFGAAAWLFGMLAWRLSSHASVGLLAAAFFVLHPSMPYAAVAWVTNQMHLLQLLVVFAALHWWALVRARPAAWWMPLLAFEVAALMVKEDGVMLVPVILVLHALRRRIAEPDLPRAPLAFVLAAAGVGAAFLAFRSHALGGIGGYHLSTIGHAWQNYRRGLETVFALQPARRPWQLEASWFVALLPVVALAGWRWISPRVRFGIVAALAAGALFNLPFIFVVKVQQLHLVAAAAAALLASSTAGLWQIASSRWLRPLTVGLIAAGLLLLAAVARDITRDFDPFGRIVRTTDDVVREWAAVPEELRAYLGRKTLPGAALTLPANPADTLETVGFGLHGWEGAPPHRYRWMSGPVAEIDVTATARRIVMPIRHEAGAFQEPAHLTVEVDGRTLDTIEMRTGDWHISDLTLRPADVPRLRRMHRVVLYLDHAWVPARIIEGSGDERTLGVQIGELEVR